MRGFRIYLYYRNYFCIYLCIAKNLIIMEYCPNCGSQINFDANICVKCGWRPYHGVRQGNIKYYPLFEQNFKKACIISAILSGLMIALCFFPLWFRKESISENTAMLILYLNIALIIPLLIWQMTQLYKYLHNFYHPLDNIFFNIRWYIASIILLSILVVFGLAIKPLSGIEGGLLLLFIGLYVLWAFMQILIGVSLIKADQYDYVGGLSALGYGILASGVAPLFILFIPFFFGNLFLKAYKYNKKLHSIE